MLLRPSMTSDANRIDITKQYFELRNSLNQANRIKNISTELEFELREDEDEYFIVIKSTGAEHGLRLAFRRKNYDFWNMHKNIIYEDFYKYVFIKIQALKPDNDFYINFILTNWLAGLWVIELKD